MTVGGWLGGGEESSLVLACLESSGGVSNTTGLSHHSNRNGTVDRVHKVRRSKTVRATDMVRAFTGSLSAMCASVVTRTRFYLEHPTRQQATRSSTVQVEDHHQQRRSSSHSQRHQHPQQQHQKRRDSGVGVAEVPTCIDYGVRRKWCWTAWMPALCAGVMAVLCYVNSLDGDFVHDDMVAVIGNPDVTGESRRHSSSSSSSSSLWINDFWGRPMADPRSHKSYRPLTVLSFR
ncbi:hypothetical protein MTO96_052111 [Rhipicephalus appendiculatus]